MRQAGRRKEAGGGGRHLRGPAVPAPVIHRAMMEDLRAVEGIVGPDCSIKSERLETC